MTPEEIQILLSAARKTLTKSHDLLDYLTLLTPIFAAALGWLAAYLQFNTSFKRGLAKERYYTSKQNVQEILKLQNDFTDFLYEFYKATKTAFGYLKPLPDDVLTDFITNYNSRLARINLTRRIEFPGSTFDDKPIIVLLRQLELHISNMNRRIRGSSDAGSAKGWPPPQPPITQTEADTFSQESSRLIDKITYEIALQENIMVKILSNEAERLGITTQMPKVHRENETISHG